MEGYNKVDEVAFEFESFSEDGFQNAALSRVYLRLNFDAMRQEASWSLCILGNNIEI